MKNYRLISIFFVLLFLAGPLSQWLRAKATPLTSEELQAVRIVLPNADRILEKSGSPAHFKAFRLNPNTGQSDFAGIAYLTTDVVPDIKGYGGPIKIMVGVNPDGTIAKIHIVSHSETATFVPQLSSFLNQFKAKNSNAAFQLGKDIDGMSGATITSDAITQAIEKSLKIMASQVLGQSASLPASSPGKLAWDQVIIPLILFTIAVIGIISHKLMIRWIALWGGLLYFGMVKSTMVSNVQFANIALLKFPGFIQSPLWYLLTGLTLLCALFWGMVFCGSLCPFATTQELLYSIAAKLGVKRLKPDPAVDEQGRYLKYIVLFSVVITSYILGNTQATGIEPFLTLFTKKGTVFAWSLVGLTLLVACFNFRFWCKYLCPVGALLGLIARVSPFRIKINRWCTGCQSCAQVCPTDAITLNSQKCPVINHAECIMCGNCIRECAQNALTLKGTDDKTEK